MNKKPFKVVALKGLFVFGDTFRMYLVMYLGTLSENTVQINDNTEEYTPKSFYESLGLFEHLIDTNSGAPQNKSWNFWDREEELSQQIKEGKITKAEADEIRKKHYLESLQK